MDYILFVVLLFVAFGIGCSPEKIVDRTIKVIGYFNKVVGSYPRAAGQHY